MANRSFSTVAFSTVIMVAALSGAVSAETDPASPCEPVEVIDVPAEGQGQTAPAWVTKGAAAFPELRGRYLFGTAKIEGVKDAGRDPARLDSVFRAMDSVNETLWTFTKGVLEAYQKAALAKPLEDIAFGELMFRCHEKVSSILGVEEGRSETYFDERTRTMHALLLVEVCVGDQGLDGLLAYAVFLGFHEELEPVHEARGLKMDAKAASGLLSDLVRAEGIKIGLDCWKK